MSEKLKAGTIKGEIPKEEPIWYDKKRVTIFALPWSFTKYLLTPTRLIVESGFLNTKEEEIKLYRITDIEYSQKLLERIGKTGTITLLSNDTSSPRISLMHVKNAKAVKELMSKTVEEARKESGVRTSEMLGNMPDCDCDCADKH